MKRTAWRTVLSMLMVLAGLGMFACGSLWAPVMLELVPETATGLWLELIVPFLPMVFVGGGALLFVGPRR